MRKSALFLVILVVAAVAATAAPPAAFDAQPRYTSMTVNMRAPVSNATAATLVIAGPDGFRMERTFATGEPIQADLSRITDAEGATVRLADGPYKWELRVVRESPASTPLTATQPGDLAIATPGTAQSYLATGAFRVEGGSIAGPIEEEPRASRQQLAVQAGQSAIPTAVATVGEGREVHAMTTNPYGNYFSGSLYASGGVGSGCSDGDVDLSYGELLVKDTVPWVTLRDTNDDQLWRFTSTAGPLRLTTTRLNGTGLTIPLQVEANTPDNTFYIDSAGLIGVGTSTPGMNLHIYGSAPRLRIENGPSNPANWEFLATSNATGGLWLRDVGQGGFIYPIKFNGGSPADSLVVSSTGNLGIGTGSPTERLTVVNPSGNASLLFDSSASANFLLDRGNTSSFSRFQFLNAGTMYWSMGMINDVSNNFHLGPNISTTYFFVSQSNGRVGIGTKTPGHPLQMGSGAHVTTGGVWTNASSRSYKQNIESLDGDEAAATLASLDPVKFEYKADPAEKHVGFIAEDVPDLVASGDRKGLSPMDIVAVLTRVLQEQQKTIAELQARVAQLESK